MRVRIGIANTDKSVEVEVDDEKAFMAELEKAVGEGGFAWFTDTRGRKVGVPGKNLAFVEMEGEGTAKAVGFAPTG